MIILQLYALNAALSSILVEKKICTKEELDSLKSKIFNLILECNVIMNSNVDEDKAKETKKYERLQKINDELAKVCNTEHIINTKMVEEEFLNRHNQEQDGEEHQHE